MKYGTEIQPPTSPEEVVKAKRLQPWTDTVEHLFPAASFIYIMSHPAYLHLILPSVALWFMCSLSHHLTTVSVCTVHLPALCVVNANAESPRLSIPNSVSQGMGHKSHEKRPGNLYSMW